MSLFMIPDVVLHVLGHLPAARYDDTSVRTLIACTKVSHALRAIARTDSVWFRHYSVRWSKPELEPGQQQWYTLYCARRETDLWVLSLLDTLITTPSKRGDAAFELAGRKDYAWGVLRMEARCKVPEGVRDVWRGEEKEWEGERWEGVGEEWADGEGKGRDMEDGEIEEVDTREMKNDWIQRRWWAKQMLGRTISRTTAVITMARVFLGDQPDPASLENARNFEDGLKALSGLMGVNVSEISHNYDNLAAECARRLVADGVCVDPAKQEFDLKEFSSAVCTWMASQGFKKAASEHYYDLMNHFPHKFTTTNRRTLPMSLVCIFVAIVTRLGLLAAPVGFPGHVHAWVALPSYQCTKSVPYEPETDWEAETPTRRLHVDVFHSDVEPFLASDSMRQTLGNLQVPREQHPMLMRPSAASEMVLRAANNILHSVTRTQHQPNALVQAEVRGAALYASAMAFVVARPQAADAARFVSGVVSVIKEQFPLDVEPVLAQLLTIFDRDPDHGGGVQLRNSIARLHDTSVDVKARAREGVPRWWVGMVFRHAKFRYVGVIMGWDEECAAGEEWILQARVERLPKGRNQPFYTVLAADGSSRYVADENVVPLPSLASETDPEQRVTWGTVRALMLASTWAVEQTFSRVEVDEKLGRAWFVPAVNTANEYPGDTALGQAYMNSPWHRYL
ncbi:hypothetical protein FRC10_001898 [Ceratobasidium sp. 414]|nr:hypothetical protein FRC10_001898 [Ceratobasidium sp. 414]